MAYDFDGKQIATTQTGYLENAEDWSEELAIHMAKSDGIELSQRHWDLLNYLRDEFANGGNQPNTRNIVKAMSKSWNEKLSQKDVYAWFNVDLSKIAGKYAGVAESRRKGGY